MKETPIRISKIKNPKNNDDVIVILWNQNRYEIVSAKAIHLMFCAWISCYSRGGQPIEHETEHGAVKVSPSDEGLFLVTFVSKKEDGPKSGMILSGESIARINQLVHSSNVLAESMDAKRFEAYSINT
ncbi:MAG: hypothetical protein KGI49_00590 [Patescibacteria group bacterium]|nr:hypothetical protein [Patescibacteria group bacterium]